MRTLIEHPTHQELSLTHQSHTTNRRYSVALTGGIAAGKTTVANHFAELGIAVIDADVLARDVVAPGSHGLQAVIDIFGDDILLANGQLNRRALRELVFMDISARQKLEAILHPLIRSAGKTAAANANSPYIIHCIPLLIETRQWQEHDRVLVVDASEYTQVHRLRQRDAVDDEHIQAILAAQASREARLAVADDIIRNTGSLPDLYRQIHMLHQQYLHFAANSNSVRVVS